MSQPHTPEHRGAEQVSVVEPEARPLPLPSNGPVTVASIAGIDKAVREYGSSSAGPWCFLLGVHHQSYTNPLRIVFLQYRHGEVYVQTWRDARDRGSDGGRADGPFAELAIQTPPSRSNRSFRPLFLLPVSSLPPGRLSFGTRAGLSSMANPQAWAGSWVGDKTMERMYEVARRQRPGEAREEEEVEGEESVEMSGRRRLRDRFRFGSGRR